MHARRSSVTATPTAPLAETTATPAPKSVSPPKFRMPFIKAQIQASPSILRAFNRKMKPRPTMGHVTFDESKTGPDESLVQRKSSLPTASSPSPTSPSTFYCAACDKSFPNRVLFDRHHAFSFMHELNVKQAAALAELASQPSPKTMHLSHLAPKFFWRLRAEAHVVIGENANGDIGVWIYQSPTAPSLEVVLLPRLHTLASLEGPALYAKIVHLVEVGYEALQSASIENDGHSFRDVRTQTLGLVFPFEYTSHVARQSVLGGTEFAKQFACFSSDVVEARLAACTVAPTLQGFEHEHGKLREDAELLKASVQSAEIEQTKTSAILAHLAAKVVVTDSSSKDEPEPPPMQPQPPTTPPLNISPRQAKRLSNLVLPPLEGRPPLA
ncbi:hypothetical protein SPRG_04693 [Saprolegnia parasitica CBS 223.65]|uniref:Uncharacterized protein n=1 Tax=Saprolegnia parasitica (strain CBS 223.65) TaxID=695850 RepID=A0A067CVH2_SAPPC|nr:hypothetical protein SPRG_04693 [Saprolegnia parasitica CBS 223.65]KDO30792.1 hypothetical protein SPRG_04693 [Saprolegnia parasitica CBS 223.65]|eukprot:XP_012198489.1 hypothetical protein SPRG_04693 [Saprolegnia parasitica CBS 223.65]